MQSNWKIRARARTCRFLETTQILPGGRKVGILALQTNDGRYAFEMLSEHLRSLAEQAAAFADHLDDGATKH